MQGVTLGGVRVDLMDSADAVQHIASHAQGADVGAVREQLAVISANLDHLAHFGPSGRWFDALDHCLDPGYTRTTRWLTLVDGAPLAAEAERLTGRSWPRLAGSDLIGPLLDEAEARGTTVGFLGGSRLVQRLLSRNLARTRPGLVVAGLWSPDRAALDDPESSRELAESIREAQVQLLVVGLGKPRQELWIAEYGPLTGANVLLAFGAVVDFLAGGVTRAPAWVSSRGLEWAWRLALEPRRLARRYLVDDPPTYVRLRRNSSLAITGPEDTTSEATRGAIAPRPGGGPDGSFAAPGEPADVAVCVVTYNSAGTVEPLIAGLRHEARRLRLRVVVADNNSTDGTLGVVSAHPDVIAIPTGGNLGYASGVNAAMRCRGDAETVLVLNPDLRVEPGAISSLYQRMMRSGAGIVVPQLLDADGRVYPSLRLEPTILRALGDAVIGRRFPGRPHWLSEMDVDPGSYRHPHRIQWATGAALLIRAELAEQLGDWDDRFFLYSEEVDYFRRARTAGAGLWFEPRARMMHARGGSGASPELDTLMAVNRIRYVRKYHRGIYPSVFRAVVVLAEALRVTRPSHRRVVAVLLDEGRWDSLPRPTASTTAAHLLERFPRGTVVIPAHDEAAVLARTLTPLAPLAAAGRIELIVACNGCTDATVDVARRFDGVRVIELEVASKATALNAADAAASLWPRIYLDADIEISLAALSMVLDTLGSGTVLAARPAFRYDPSGADFLVRAYYRARRRLPSTTQSLWGAGVYGLTEVGHARLGVFPAMTADDLLVDSLFDRSEKAVVNTPPVGVRTPRTASSLLGILTRIYRGNTELSSEAPTSTGLGATGTQRTVRELLTSVRGPTSAFDAVVYGSFAALARGRAFRSAKGVEATWERDESSRRR